MRLLSFTSRYNKETSNMLGHLVVNATSMGVTGQICSPPLWTAGSGPAHLLASHPPTPPSGGAEIGQTLAVETNPSQTTESLQRPEPMRLALRFWTTSTTMGSSGTTLLATTSNRGCAKTRRSSSLSHASTSHKLTSHKYHDRLPSVFLLNIIMSV